MERFSGTQLLEFRSTGTKLLSTEFKIRSVIWRIFKIAVKIVLCAASALREISRAHSPIIICIRSKWSLADINLLELSWNSGNGYVIESFIVWIDCSFKESLTGLRYGYRNKYNNNLPNCLTCKNDAPFDLPLSFVYNGLAKLSLNNFFVIPLNIVFLGKIS